MRDQAIKEDCQVVVPEGNKHRPNNVESQKYSFVLWEVMKLLLNDLQTWNSFQIGIVNFHSLAGKKTQVPGTSNAYTPQHIFPSK